MAEHAHITCPPTRRSLFAAAPVLALAPAVALASPATGPMQALLAERNRLADWVNGQPAWAVEREPEREAIHSRVVEMENRIVAGPATADGARAKLGLFLRLDAEGTEIHHDAMVPIIREALALLGGA